MVHIFGITLFATLLVLPAPLGAQGHGGRGVASGAIVRSAPPAGVPVTGFVSHPVAPFVTHPVAPFGAIVHVAPHFQNVRPPRTAMVTQPFGFYSPYLWPTPFSAPVYPQSAYVTSPVPQQPVVSRNELELSYELGRLSREVELLRSEQAARAPIAAPTPVKPVPEASAIPSVLVFRDGHRVEIQNYAIIGQTLMVLDTRAFTRISIGDLDLDATQKENRSRGAHFLLPAR